MVEDKKIFGFNLDKGEQFRILYKIIANILAKICGTSEA